MGGDRAAGVSFERSLIVESESRQWIFRFRSLRKCGRSRAAYPEPSSRTPPPGQRRAVLPKKKPTMSALTTLWLPILLSAVFVFIVSTLIHMVFKWHAPDYKGLANEDAVREAIRAGAPAPGSYVLPHCQDMKDMAGEAMMKKYDEGPVGYLTLVPNGPPKIPVSLLQWFVLSLAVSAVAAILAGKYVGLAPGGGRAAFYLVGIACFLGYGFGNIQDGIWKGVRWSSVALYLVDSALYAGVSAVTFRWLWP
jgi:hypothetical protein